MMRDGYLRNERIYYFYSTFAELLILGPIMVLFLIAKGLNFTEIMLLQSISAIGTVIFEVPTGAVADRIGRKQSLLLGSILWAISLGFYIVGTNFVIFALAEITFSLGAAFKSGADSAMIYDSLKASGREKGYSKVEGKARSLALYAQAIGSIISSFVYEVNIYLPMILSIIFMLITFIITLYFKEPTIEIAGEREKNYWRQVLNSGKYILGHEKLKAVIVFSMVFFIFYRTGFWYFQPYMEAVNIPVRYFGLIFFVFNITAAFSSKRSGYIMDKTKPRTLTFMAGLMIISFLILGICKIWIGVIAILLQQIARGVYRPAITKYMNKHIPSDKRATILSFQSLCTNVAIALAFPFMGLLKDSVDIFLTHKILFLTMLLMTLPALKYMKSRLGNKKLS
ncbi:MFS transporter [Desnuesiella massiliensis]|uniref:MFS transporter n=1 Tax=Desnuesiella massiliensis TaxID=1650662 RepID=UPI0006E33D14|nr:MFS transporter [Desnuesiella massiliensis]